MLDYDIILANCLIIVFFKRYVSFALLRAQEIEIHVYVEGM